MFLLGEEYVARRIDPPENGWKVKGKTVLTPFAYGSMGDWILSVANVFPEIKEMAVTHQTLSSNDWYIMLSKALDRKGKRF